MSLLDMKLGSYRDLVNACLELKNDFAEIKEPSTSLNSSIKKCLDDIFEGVAVCNAVLFTNNTDKFTFGVFVDPYISDQKMAQIILGDDNIDKLTDSYSLEIDMTLFKTLNAEEVAAYIVEDISSMLDPVAIDNVRYIFDSILVNNGDYIDIRPSINYSQILIYGIKDALQKLTSLLFKYPDSIGTNIYANAFNTTEILNDVAGMIRKDAFGIEDITRMPKMGIVQWVLMVYKDLDINYKMAESTLMEARELTGSVLEQKEIDKTLKAIRRAITEILRESAISTEKIYNEISLFKKIKKKGLMAIQDDLFEYKIRIKNCEEMEEAMYILRQINSRIGILEDYLDNNECSDAERAHWMAVIDDYIKLRIDLSNKKLGPKKQYNVWYDIDAIDKIKD